MRQAEADRLIEVSWADKAANVFNASIKVVGNTQTEILASVAAAVSELKLEIVSTNGRTDNKTKQVIVDFNIRLNSKEELERLIAKLKQAPKIADVYRTGN